MYVVRRVPLQCPNLIDSQESSKLKLDPDAETGYLGAIATRDIFEGEEILVEKAALYRTDKERGRDAAIYLAKRFLDTDVVSLEKRRAILDLHDKFDPEN